MRCGLSVLLLLAGGASVADAASPRDLIATIQAVGKEGQGHQAAQPAMRELSQQRADALPRILTGLNDANPLAANWLRNAFETIADRELSRSGTLPTADLERFIQDRQNDPRARRLAYEWLLKVEPQARERLIPSMLTDPGAEFRRDAVQRLIDAARKADERKDGATAKELCRQALVGATDDDQVQAIVKRLRELGEQVDLQEHFGFLVEWRFLGPFDNAGNKGYDTAYPPESELNFDAAYQGKNGEVRWEPPHRTDQEYGIVDLAKATAPHKGACTYAATEFVSPKEQSVELRLGTPNAWKLWINGKLAFARDEYHRNMQLDQYRVPVHLKQGRNTILLKICQNEQTEDWAQRWQYQIRVCDSSGAAIHSADSPANSRKQAARDQEGAK